MNYNLLIDDERNLKDIYWVELPVGNWIVVRNYDDFVKTIEKNGLPNYISFDNDLGQEKEGYDAAKWLINYCLDNGDLKFPNYSVHSQNPIAKDRIISIIENYKRIFN